MLFGCEQYATAKNEREQLAEPAASPLENTWQRYVNEVDGDKQFVEIMRKNDNLIAVRLALSGACSLNELGDAELATAGDLDIMEDPSGESIPVETYVLSGRGDCYFNLYLEDQGRYVWVSGGCDQSCYFNLQPMRRE
ncbi:hypothetical protein DXX93_15045 [Thalassotalea euphylliae]|uniref:Uncharacterized protein n=1 Tax=Thalassotalea euphylliae TaxID=1655234 RepID=A0A3E0TUY8_9GAMM|nr:hypothetical protein [Thalassotalea euphylliae]REL27745.1 hypothetical protein DXX93_15045 [Thalassotalea euphylliae]